MSSLRVSAGRDEKDSTIASLVSALAKRDEELAKRDREIEALKGKLGEMTARLEEANAAPKPGLGLFSALDQDRMAVLTCWRAMDGREDALRNGHGDDVPRWWGILVEWARVTGLSWHSKNLTGTIASEIGALSALTYLAMAENKLVGPIPPEIGALTSLKCLRLDDNALSGIVPSSFSNLKNLETLTLKNTNISNPPIFVEYEYIRTQTYLAFMNRPSVLRFLNTGIAITKKRQDSLSTDPAPFFAFLATYEDSLADHILSYLDPLYCCNSDRTAVLKCWKSLGGAEDDLRQGYKDDVAR